VETRPLVVQGDAEGTHALFTRTECAEVLCCLWHGIVKQFKLNAASGSATNRQVEEHVRSATATATTHWWRWTAGRTTHAAGWRSTHAAGWRTT